MTASPARPAARVLSALTALVWFAVLGVLAGAVWWAWMGWDADDVYDPWQVIGCVLTLLVVALVAYHRLDVALVGAAMTLGFTVAVAWSWMSDDEQGLAAIGVMMVFTAMAAVATVLGGAVALAQNARSGR